MQSRAARARGSLVRVSSFAVVSLLMLALLPGVAAAATPGSTNWKLTAGAQSRDEGIQANAFLPRDVSVNVGDTITWTVATGEFHTVTFLSGAQPPDLIINTPTGPGLNPAAVAPSGVGPYKGSGIFNSGLLVQNQAYTLGFGQAGDFLYQCLVHKEMKAVVHVRSDATPVRQTQALVDVAGKAEAAGLLGQGIGLEAQGFAAALASGHGAVTAGIGKFIPGFASLAIVRFEPQRQVVHVGEAVTWTNLDPEFPHTITFGTEPQGGPLAAFPPSGFDPTKTPGHATISTPGQSVNSG